jgi:hypothetical protein
MLALASSLQQVTADCSRFARLISLAILLMPGLSFWSSAIGKDTLTFMAAGLATWGALDLSRRYPALFIATFVFLFARPHMAGILLVSIVFALLFASRVGLAKQTLLLTLALPAAVFGFNFGLEFAGITEVAGISDITEYFKVRQNLNLEGGSSVDITSMSVPMRMVTYLFRPFFFDAGGFQAFAVSVENLFLSILVLGATVFIFKGRRSRINSFAAVFFVTFIVLSWFVLANTTANLGIAIRQKWMFMPMLLVLASSYIFKIRR